jgi:threonyl-tRNA synthetase
MRLFSKSATLDEIRHSLAHLLAAAVLKKYPETKLGVGPVIETGFYYDFVFPSAISPEDLKEFEESMREMVKAELPFEGKVITPQEAHKLFANQPFKRELIEEYSGEGKELTAYKTGDVFEDLCRGGHVKNTSEIDPDSFKLDKIAGAYWRGDEKNPQMTRIYGLAFASKKELAEYLAMREEAEKRDHRKLGRELDLFAFSEYVGSGLPLYTPRGAFIRRSLNDYVEELQSKAGYTQVWTPQIAKAELFKISGHYDKYKDSMFRVVSNYSEEEFFLKPMNCPQHTQIYDSQPRSYRDLPLRYADFAMLYRDEKPGELNGLARTRSFSQDDCHIFCREDQVDKEIDLALRMTKEVMQTFGLKYRYRLSTSDKSHPEKYLGDPKTWDKVEKWAEKIMQRNGIDYFDAPGEAAFYAPKMDLMATDALGREWQLSTVQIDFVQPERFKLNYIGEDGQKKTPVIIHRAIIGSSERFMMMLLEHFAGKFPVWLAPTQVRILPVSEKFLDYGRKLEKELTEKNARVELSDVNETLGKRIREAEMQKVPYVLVVGEKEESNNSVNVRHMARGQEGEMSMEKFLDQLKNEVRDKKI